MIADRERVGVSFVGEVTDTGRVILEDDTVAEGGIIRCIKLYIHSGQVSKSHTTLSSSMCLETCLAKCSSLSVLHKV